MGPHGAVGLHKSSVENRGFIFFKSCMNSRKTGASLPPI